MWDYLLYYPVTFILWVWHKVFGTVFGPEAAISWVLGIVFLTFTVRAIMFKPFVHQVRSMKKMQDFAPEIKKIQKRYANDKQRQAQAMQKLQREHGVNPLGGCLPILIQIPVFIGLNHVLRAFQVHHDLGWGNYMFSPTETDQYIAADLFGSNLGEAVYNVGAMGLPGGGFNSAALPVAIPLMVLASMLTHLTARHSVARQNPANANQQQTAIMNKLTLYVFPVGLLVFGVMIPLGLLVYFLANNAWTLMQQRVVYRKIDREEEEKKAAAIEKRTALGPKPGQKPDQQKKRQAPNAPKPGQKPAGTQKGGSGQKAGGSAQKKPGQKPSQAGESSSPNGKSDSTSSSAQSGDGSGTGVPGMISDSTKKKSGRKRR